MHFSAFRGIIRKNIKKEEIYNQALEKIKTIETTTPDFTMIFDFCTFVRSVEKVFFFKNDIYHNTISSDYHIDSVTERNLCINTDKYSIILDLSIKDFAECINIKVVRKYGKKLGNNFKIRDRHIVYNDCDDLMLINIINKLLQKYMSKMFKHYIDIVYNDNIIDIDTLEFNNINVERK